MRQQRSWSLLAGLGMGLLLTGCSKSEPNKAEFQHRLEAQGGWSNITWTTYNSQKRWYAVRAAHLIGDHTYYFDIQLNDGDPLECLREDKEVGCPSMYSRWPNGKERGLTEDTNDELRAHSSEVHRLADQFWDAFFSNAK